jgi:ferric-dicitrate binding protein FerR (iron transport regulator)
MLQMSPKQMLAVLLAIVMIRPFPAQAAPAAAVLGSISTYGAASVGVVSAPAESTLFAGDLVNTGVGNAVVQYKEGARVVLASDSSAQFSADEVRLQKGQMTFRSAAEGGPVFNATSLRLEPAAANSSANVVLKDGTASVSVSEGVLQVVDPTGAKLASIKAGETKLFAMASAAPAPAAASPAAAAPPKVIGGVPIWGVVLAVGAVAITTATAIILNNNASDNAAALSPVR